MNVTINGKQHEIPEGMTVQSLLEQLDLHPRRVAIELNLEIVRRARFGETELKPNDSIEILQFVGGG